MGRNLLRKGILATGLLAVGTFMGISLKTAYDLGQRKCYEEYPPEIFEEEHVRINGVPPGTLVYDFGGILLEDFDKDGNVDLVSFFGKDGDFSGCYIGEEWKEKYPNFYVMDSEFREIASYALRTQEDLASTILLDLSRRKFLEHEREYRGR